MGLRKCGNDSFPTYLSPDDGSEVDGEIISVLFCDELERTQNGDITVATGM